MAKKNGKKGMNFMKISSLGNNFSKAAIEVHEAASKSLNQALNGKGMDYINDAFQKEGGIVKFPGVFSSVVKGGVVGCIDFISNFVKNVLK